MADVLAQFHDRIKAKVIERTERVRRDDEIPPKERIEKKLFIRTKEKTVVNLKFNPIQELYWGERTRRDIILKPRQLGFSTLILAEFFDDTINNPNTTTVIIAHDSDSTRKLFNAVQFMYNNLPEGKKLQLNNGKTKPKYGNRKEFYFEAINSRITVGTAGSIDFGRGDTIHNLHCSEVAFWPDPETLMTGLLQAIPFNGRIVLETTANGVGNYFYRTYQEAKEGGQWAPHFYRWFDHPDYKLPLEPGESLVYSSEEKKLIELYQLSDEQIKWRRWKIGEMPSKDGISKEDRFKQEYPEDDISCFLNSGRPALNLSVIKDMQKVAQQTAFTRYTIDDAKPNHEALFEDTEGELKIFEQPMPGVQYIIAADPSEGKANGDASAAQVIEKDSARQVARIHTRCEPDIFGKKLARLGYWYNTAIIGVERNNHGHSVLNTLHNYECYPNLYYHTEYDASTQKESQVLGFPTNPKTRPIMISDLQSAVREKWLAVYDLDTLGEMFTFIINEQGKAEAQEGCHDDLVLALAISLQIRKFMLVSKYVVAPFIGGIKRG